MRMGNEQIPEGFDKERIVAAAFHFLVFLDANLGDTTDWPVTMTASPEVIDELVAKLNELRAACGIQRPSHADLYQRPPG